MVQLADLLDRDDPDTLFQLIEEIASGAFGTVYKGVHLPTGNIVAVKIIQPEEDDAIEDLMVEIEILKKCSHPNIVKFYGAYKKGEEIFIAMELCDGGAVNDIFSVVEEGLTEDQIGFIARESLKGLSYLHELSIIHRDIKGGNVLLTKGGEVKLVDFGVSFQAAGGRKAKTFIGTPYWMAPEVIAAKTGLNTYDYKADIWSIGIMCIELAETNPPLSDIHPMRALFQIPIKEPPKLQNPSQWSKEFNEFIAKCLIKDPRNRPSAKDILSHPFLQKRFTTKCIQDLIAKKKAAEANAGDGPADDDLEGEPLPDEDEPNDAEMAQWLSGGGDGGADDDLELLDEDDVDAWLGSSTSTEKPQTQATIKPKQQINAEDWADSDEEDEEDEDEDEDDYDDRGRREDPSDPFSGSALKDLERESKKKPVPRDPTLKAKDPTIKAPPPHVKPPTIKAERPPTIKKGDQRASEQVVSAQPLGPKPIAPAASSPQLLGSQGGSQSKLTRPPPKHGSTVRPSTDIETVRPEAIKSTPPPKRAPPKQPQQQAVIASDSPPLTPTALNAKGRPVKREKSQILASVADLNTGRSTLARPASRRTTMSRQTQRNNAMNEVNKKLVQLQMRELRRCQEKQKKEVIKMKQALEKEEAALMANVAENEKNALRSQNTTQEALRKQQVQDLDQVRRQQQRESKAAEKQLADNKALQIKEIEKVQKADAKAFAEKAKTEQARYEKEQKSVLKKEKTISKKQQKSMLAERLKAFEVNARSLQLVFQHGQNFTRLSEEHKLQQRQLEEFQKLEQEQLKQMHQLSLEQLQHVHQQQDEHLRHKQQLIYEKDHNLHPMQLRHEQEEQEQVYQHLLQIQTIEMNQQAKVFDADRKKKEKEFRAKQKAELEEHKREIRNYGKKFDKSKVKEATREAEAKFNQQQQQQLEAFNRGLQRDREREEQELKELHKFQQKQIKEEHYRRQEELLRRNFEEQAEHQRIAHEQTRELRAAQQKEQLDLLTKLQSEQLQLQMTQHQTKLQEQDRQHKEQVERLQQLQAERKNQQQEAFKVLKTSLLQAEINRQEKALEMELKQQMDGLLQQLQREAQQLRAETEQQRLQLQQYQQNQRTQLAQYQSTKTQELHNSQAQEVNQLKARQQKEHAVWAQREAQKLGLSAPGGESHRDSHRESHRDMYADSPSRPVGPSAIGRGGRRV